MGIVTISQEEYDAISLEAAKYRALMAAGVDNWDWYSDALAEFYKEDD